MDFLRTLVEQMSGHSRTAQNVEIINLELKNELGYAAAAGGELQLCLKKWLTGLLRLLAFLLSLQTYPPQAFIYYAIMAFVMIHLT
jgi:hypothetical protein